MFDRLIKGKLLNIYHPRKTTVTENCLHEATKEQDEEQTMATSNDTTAITDIQTKKKYSRGTTLKRSAEKKKKIHEAEYL